jgi:hypothetical protein
MQPRGQLLDFGEKSACPPHSFVGIEFAIGHDPETNIPGALRLLRAVCLSCGMIRKIPVAAFDDYEEAEVKPEPKKK